ncbi:class I and II aminotransferase [Sesbania bispinosa]|nr:class I and II aminotransferase [Sesbania bispinosa]
MVMQQIRGITLSPNMTEANNMLHHLLVVAQHVTSGKQYNWKKVAAQLGLSQDEGYMNFMQQVDEAKKFCGVRVTDEDDAGEGGGT